MTTTTHTIPQLRERLTRIMTRRGWYAEDARALTDDEAWALVDSLWDDARRGVNPTPGDYPLEFSDLPEWRRADELAARWGGAS